MSVVTSRARRRWAVVAAGVALLVAVPVGASAVADSVAAGRDRPQPRELLARALDSDGVGYTGLAESRGSLGLPDLPQLETVSAELGGTTRMRVWWAGPDSSRLDVLTPTGEQGVYDADGTTFLWDYERETITEVLDGDPAVRLPRADDLTPPAAARRLLAGVGADDTVTALPGVRKVAGVEAVGVRIVPGDARSTIARLDVWLAPDDALPLRLDIVDDRGVTALSTAFTDLDRNPPDAAAIRPPSAPGAVHDRTTTPDIVTRISEFRRVELPGTLAGLPAGDSLVGSTVTYGTGLTRIVAQPLPGRIAGGALDAVRSGGGQELGLSGGDAVMVTAGAISVVVLRTEGSRRGYLVAGPVTPEVVTEAARELLATPPPGTGR